MRKNDPAHGGSASGALFAERHVYMRSGAESRYVVLTRPLQIGVVIGGALILAALAFAGGSAIVSRLAAIEQRREIARLEMVVQTLRTAAADQDAAAAGLRAGPDPQGQVERAGAAARQSAAAVEDEGRAGTLAETARRDQPLSERAREGATSTPAGAGEQASRHAPQLERRLAHAREALARLTAQLAAAETAAVAAAGQQVGVQPAQAGFDADAAGSLAQLKANDRDGQLQQLRSQLASAAATSASLGEDLAAAQREASARAGATFGPDDASEIARLRAQLRRANERIDLLEARADPEAPAPAPPAPR